MSHLAATSMERETLEMTGSLQAFIGTDEGSIQAIENDARYLDHVLNLTLKIDSCRKLRDHSNYLGGRDRFKDVIDTFLVPKGETPAGFRLNYVLDKDRVVRVDLIRDISYNKNGEKRPSKTLFSADSANPCEVATDSLFAISSITRSRLFRKLKTIPQNRVNCLY